MLITITWLSVVVSTTVIASCADFPLARHTIREDILSDDPKGSLRTRRGLLWCQWLAFRQRVKKTLQELIT